MTYTLKDYYKRIRSNGATAARAYELAKQNFDKQREYNEAWQAGNQFADKGSELSTIRKATIELLQAIKNKQSEPIICKAISAQINRQLADYSNLKKERAKI